MIKADKIGLVRGNVVIAGVDVAKKRHYAQVVDRFGRHVEKPLRFQNSREGFERLEGTLVRLQAKTGAESVVVGMEPTGHYWKPLAWWLRERGFTVVMVNPMAVKRHKEDHDNSPSKSDRKDAGVIADLVLQGKFLQCLLPRGIYAELRGLAVSRRQQKQKWNAAVNNLEAVLDEFFPEFPEVFKDPLGMGASWVLEHCPLPSQIVEVPVEKLAEQLRKAANGRMGRKRAERLREVAQRSVGVPDGSETARLRIRSALNELRFWRGELDRTEAAMKDALERTGFGEFLLSIPGVGVVTAATFLGEIGDPAQYQSWRQIQKLAGLNVVENSSGQHRGKRQISKRGRPGLRCVLYQAAVCLVAVNPEFKALYRHFLSRPVNPLKKKAALVAVGLKLLRVMVALMRHQRMYDGAEVLGKERQRQRNAA